MPRRYLVTGGAGFLGSALVRRLVRDGHAVRCLDDGSRGADRRLAGVRGTIDVVVGDVRDAGVVHDAVRGADSVLHLAYVNGTEFFYSRPEFVLDVGVRGMLNVLDACRAHEVPELVLASSSEVYQHAPSIPTGESVPLSVPDVLNPRYSYGGGKIASELMAVNWGRSGFERVMVFRPHNVYGPDMGWEHVLPQFVLRLIDAIKRGEQDPSLFPIQGDGSQTRAFMHVDDFVQAIACLLEYGEHLGIYHVGNPEEVAVADVAWRLAEHFGRQIALRPGPLPAGGVARRCPDISRLRALGFEPQVPLEEGLPSLAEWYEANAHLSPHTATGRSHAGSVE